jgi:phospho-acceptor domain-containing protein
VYRVLLLLDHRGNAEVLCEWLAAQDLEVADADATDADVVICDAGRLYRERAGVWNAADEILTTPIRAGELKVRMDRLPRERERSQSLSRRTEELGRSNVDLGQFADVAAHEFASPLAVVAGALETLAGPFRDQVDPSLAPLLDAARRESERLQTLIATLLALPQAGRPLEVTQVTSTHWWKRPSRPACTARGGAGVGRRRCGRPVDADRAQIGVTCSGRATGGSSASPTTGSASPPSRPPRSSRCSTAAPRATAVGTGSGWLSAGASSSATAVPSPSRRRSAAAVCSASRCRNG